MAPLKPTEKIFVADHGGLIGTAITKLLAAEGGAEVVTRTPAQLDLCSQSDVRQFLFEEQPTQIYMSVGCAPPAGRRKPAWLIAESTRSTNLLGEAHRAGVPQLLLVGCGCVYPVDAPAPHAEEDLLGGAIPAGSAGHAVVVMAALKLCESINLARGDSAGSPPDAYRSLITATPFGPCLDGAAPAPEGIGALLQQLHNAKVQGATHTTLPFAEQERQDLLVSSDVATAALQVMHTEASAYRLVTTPTRGFLNVSHDTDMSNGALADTLASIVGYRGKLVFAPARGQAGRSHRLDSFRLRSLGWRPKLAMEDALALAYLDLLSRERSLAGCATVR